MDGEFSEILGLTLASSVGLCALVVIVRSSSLFHFSSALLVNTEELEGTGEVLMLCQLQEIRFW